MSTTAELGLRIYLQDMASGGLGSLVGNLGILGSHLHGLMGVWNDMNGLMKGAAITAVGSGILFAGFAAALKDVVDKGADLQDTMIQVKIAVRGAGAEMQTVQDYLVGLANNSKFTTKEIGDGFIQLGEHGFTAAQIIKGDMGGAFTNFAEAINSDVQPAAYLLSSTMQTFGANTQESAHYADMLTGMFYNGVPKITDMQQALAQVGGQANTAGWSFSDLATALDILARHGLPASQAATSLRYTLVDLQSPVPHVLDDMAAIGLVVMNKTAPALQELQAKMRAAGDAMGSVQWDGTAKGLQQIYTEANKIPGLHIDESFNAWAASTGIMKSKLIDAKGNLVDFKTMVQEVGDALKHATGTNKDAYNKLMTDIMGGARSGKAGSILFGNPDQIVADINKIKPAIDKSGQAAKDAQDRMASWNMAVKKLQTTFADLEAVIGQKLIGPMTDIVNKISEFIGKVSLGNPQFTQLAGRFLLVGAGLSGLLFVLGLATLIFGALSTPILLVFGAMALIAGIALVVAANWGRIMGVLHPVIVFFQKAGGQIGQALQPIAGAIQQAFGESMKSAMPEIKKALEPLPGLFKQLKDALGGLAPLIPALLFIFKALAVGIAGAVILGIRAFALFLAGMALVVTGIVGIITGIVQYVSAVIGIIVGIFNRNGTQIRNSWNLLWLGVNNILTGILKLIVGVITAVFGGIIGTVDGFVQKIIGFFTHLADILVGHSIIPDMLRDILNWFKTVFSQIIGTVSGWVNNVVNFFTQLGINVVNAVTNGFNLVKNTVMVTLIYLSGLVQQKVLEVVNWFRTGYSQLSGVVQGAMSQAQNAVSNGVGAMINFVSSLPGRITGALSNLGNLMYNSGANAVSMLAQGIVNSIGAVVNAAGQVAQAVADHLAHKSPTKKGPLSTGDTFMPNMMRMHAQGIINSIPLLTKAASQAAGAIALPFSSPASSHLALAASAGSRGGAAGGGTINQIHIYMDSKEISTATFDNLKTVFSMNGLSRIHYK